MKSIKFTLGAPYVDEFRHLDGETSNINFNQMVRYNGKDILMRVEVPNAHISIRTDDNGQEQLEVEAYQNYFCFEESQLLSLNVNNDER